MSTARRGVTFALGSQPDTPKDEPTDAEETGFLNPDTFSSPAYSASVGAPSRHGQLTPGSTEIRSSLRRRSTGVPSPIRYPVEPGLGIEEGEEGEGDDGDDGEEGEESGSELDSDDEDQDDEDQEDEEQDDEDEDGEDQEDEDQGGEDQGGEDQGGEDQGGEDQEDEDEISETEEDDDEDDGDEDSENSLPYRKRFKKGAEIAIQIPLKVDLQRKKPFKKVFIAPPPEISDTDEPPLVKEKVESTPEITMRFAFKKKRKTIISPILHDSSEGSDYEDSVRKKSPPKPLPPKSAPRRARGKPATPASRPDDVYDPSPAKRKRGLAKSKTPTPKKKRTAVSLPPEELPEAGDELVTPGRARKLPPPATDKPIKTRHKYWEESSSPFPENSSIHSSSSRKQPSSPIPDSEASFKNLIDENAQLSAQIAHLESENEKFVGLAEVLGEITFTGTEQPLIEELMIKRTELSQARESEGESWVQVQKLRDQIDDLKSKIRELGGPTSKPRKKGRKQTGGGDDAADFANAVAAIQVMIDNLDPDGVFADQRLEALTHRIRIIRLQEGLRLSQLGQAEAAADSTKNIEALNAEIANLRSGQKSQDNCQEIRVRLREAQRQLDAFKEFPEDMRLNIAHITDVNIVAQWEEIYTDIMTLCAVNYAARPGFSEFDYTAQSDANTLTSYYIREVTLRRNTMSVGINNPIRSSEYDYRTQVSAGIFYKILVDEIFNPVHYMITLRFQDPSQRWKHKNQLKYAYGANDFFRQQTQGWFQERLSWADKRMEAETEALEPVEPNRYRPRIRPNFNYFRAVENTQLMDNGDIRSVLVLRAKLMYAIFSASEDGLGDKSKELRESVSALIRDTLRPFRLQPGVIVDGQPPVLSHGALKLGVWNILKKAYILALNISFQPTVIFPHNEELLSMIYFDAATMVDVDAAPGASAADLHAYHAVIERESRALERMESAGKVGIMIRPILSKKGLQDGAIFDIRGWTTLSPAVVALVPELLEDDDPYDRDDTPPQEDAKSKTTINELTDGATPTPPPPLPTPPPPPPEVIELSS